VPLYDYRCTECGREVEVIHGIHDSGPETCQHCGAAMRKALSTPAIHFKGSGWAKKDAAAATAKKAQPKADSSSGSTSATDKASDSKSSDSAAPAKTSETSTSGEKAKASTATSSD
jgi:putative FmdB family regulatory protein